VIHILVGAADEVDSVLEAAKNGKSVAWRVPKKSHANEPVLFYLPGHGFAARGLIATEPREYELGRYGADVRAVVLLAFAVPLAFVHKNHPSWKWLNAKMKSYTTIDGAIEERLEELLNEYQTSFTEPLTEGTSKAVSVTVFERNALARQQCIAHYGTECHACGFSFGETYGETAAGYIHVHHLRAVSERGGRYVVDPIKDLRPICPNCHAVVHFQSPPLSIMELKRMLKRARAETNR
jgi:hypothetical protein